MLILQHTEGEWIGSMNDGFAEPSRVNNFILHTVRLDHGSTLPASDSFDWLLIMGGLMSVNDESDYLWLREEKQLIRQSIADDKTIIGICLGGQMIASAAGAEVYRNSTPEIGWFAVIRTDTDVTWLPETASLLSWHGDCFRVPVGARPFATSHMTPCQGFSLGPRIWVLQFHLQAQSGTVAAFLALEPHGLPEGEYVQRQQQLLSEAFLSRSQTIMHGLLDSLV
ncbi:type 1 glutamine amidotransferase [Amphritea pacifica]|uniref:Type 1 glutamine amidotransferase n=1 Tax=Amphritea pacifica TaxID=2811233 RepID=A0ABS2W6U3_9GAMM|nr:type 1 glutamine amidotransferase [Amphritea pacifica]